jgi:hypothetical protein
LQRSNSLMDAIIGLINKLHRFMGKNSKTFYIGRKADTGELCTVDYARKHPDKCLVERMPKTGYGDTK